MLEAKLLAGLAAHPASLVNAMDLKGKRIATVRQRNLSQHQTCKKLFESNAWHGTASAIQIPDDIETSSLPILPSPHEARTSGTPSADPSNSPGAGQAPASAAFPRMETAFSNLGLLFCRHSIDTLAKNSEEQCLMSIPSKCIHLSQQNHLLF